MALNMIQLPEELVTEIYSKAKGHSSLAKLSANQPLPFNGEKQFVFSLPGEASIVAEGAAKPNSGDATMTGVVIRPIKFIYQTRVSDEFMKASDEARLPYLETFGVGFAAKIGRALDIAAMHGLNPKDSTPVQDLAGKCFDGVITNVVVYDSSAPDDNLDAAIAAIVANNQVANGMAISPTFGAQMAKVKVNGVVQYPEFRFGGAPNALAGSVLDMNNTVSVIATGGAADHVIVGDFENAFRWGYAKNVPLEVIEYGDPDGTGRDLKQFNEVCLRAEAYIGWGILDKDAFAVVRAASQATEPAGDESDEEGGEG